MMREREYVVCNPGDQVVVGKEDWLCVNVYDESFVRFCERENKKRGDQKQKEK